MREHRMKNRRKQVALLVSPGWYASAVLIRGVQDYARTHGDWTIVPIHENFSGTLGDLMDWNGDGVIAACHAAGLRVPEDVAVMGGGNSKGVCEFCDPPLSGVQRANYEMGTEAAALLDRMMAGETAPAQDVLLAPKGIVQRRSTEVLAVEDPHVRTAVEYIREHVGEAFGVEQLTELIPVSRRWLEERFREALGCTPHEHISRTRVAEAKKLLVGSPKMPLVDVAAKCGFTSPKRLRIVFERFVGTSPAAYRAQEINAAQGEIFKES